MNLIPGDDALFQGLDEACLRFLLDRLPPIGDDEGGALDRDIVILAPAGFEPAALDKSAVRTDDSDDMLARLEPVAVEDWNVGIGGADDDVRALGHVARIVERNELRIDEARDFLAEAPAIFGSAAVDLI